MEPVVLECPYCGGSEIADSFPCDVPGESVFAIVCRCGEPYFARIKVVPRISIEGVEVKIKTKCSIGWGRAIPPKMHSFMERHGMILLKSPAFEKIYVSEAFFKRNPGYPRD